MATMALSVVYPPPGSTGGGGSAVDVVAVHGLGGDAINTWTHPTSHAFWLRDFLPLRIPDARVLTFTYDAAAAFGQSTAEVIDHAKSLLSSLVDKREEADEKNRPLIFVAHSLGGIVVKQALLQARLEPRYQPIRDATLGILFFGTPHRGSEKATYGKVLASVAQTLSRRPPPRLLTALQTNSDVLLRLTSDFRFQLPHYHVVSFYELRPMGPFSSLIVEKHSALLEVEHEEQIPVDADHSAICKFETDESDTFEKTYKRIRRMRNDPRLVVVKDPAKSFNQFFEVPHLLSTVFTGQDHVCQRLDESLAFAQTHAHTHPLTSKPPIQRRFVLFGLGGSGKTQICVRYAQVHRQRYWGIFWVDASTPDTIQRSITQLALLLQVKQDVECIKRALAHAAQPWLLVLDNADDPKLQLATYFPPGERGDIIITSRNPASCQYSSVGHHEVAQMLPSDAEVLLLKTVYGDTNVDDETRQGGRRVVQTLAHLALAITQAGAYIRVESCGFDEYLQLYSRCQKEVMEYRPRHGTTDYPHSVYATWQVSVGMITSIGDAASMTALQVLQLLGFYHHDEIPFSMFYNAWRNSGLESTDYQWMPWPPTISDFFDLQRAVQASISLLASYSLVKRNSNVSISMHPLVHDWCRLRLSVDEQESMRRRAVTLLAHSITWKFETTDYTFRRSILSHVHACLRSCEPGRQEPTVALAREWDAMALVLGENGAPWEALGLSEQAVRICKSKLGEYHPDTLRSTHNLAIWYGEAGRREEALRLVEQVTQISKRNLGEDHPDTLKSIHNLAILYSEAGRREEALRLTEQVVQISKSSLGEDHPDTLASMHNLAIQYNEAGQREEALRLVEQVVQLYKSKLGEEHPSTLTSMHNLAIRYSEAGRREEALRLAEQVLQMRKIKQGEAHPDTIISEELLALILKESNEDTENSIARPAPTQ